MIYNLKKLILGYKHVPKPILLLIGAELMLHLMTSAFMLILNIYLRKQGFLDDQIAFFTSFRFLGVLLFAFPMGLFIKGKRLKPYFIAGSLIVPASSFLMLEAAQNHILWLMQVCFFGWGFGFMLLQVCVLPFIMRHASKDILTESISLNYSTWSFATVASGLMIAILGFIGQVDLGNISFTWNEYHILRLITTLSTLSIALMIKIEEADPPAFPKTGLRLDLIFSDYDWDLIIRAVIPTVIIATGAGLTIPFINLFFFTVFDIDYGVFSIIGSFTAGFVFLGAIFVPLIKKNFGYKIGITLTQSLAVSFLIIMALTELVADKTGVVYIAVICYIFRQPLMNMAGPLTSELTMNYVGEKNQELISALMSSIWSGSWFTSAKIFQYLRGMNLPYYQVFLITACLYALGVFLYYLLINDYLRRVAQQEAVIVCQS